MAPDKYTASPMSAADISARYNGKSQSDGRYRIPCTAHGGKDKNLVIWDGDGGGLGAKCFSGRCSYQDILDSLGVEFTYKRLQYRRSNGDKVERHRGPDKQITGRGSNKGLLIRLWGVDKPGNIIVLVEGEKAAAALLAYGLPGYTAACWSGGGAAVTMVDYSPLKGREVVLWPDNDTAGLEAMNKAGQAAVAAGADHVRIVDPKALPDKADVADVSPDAALNLLASTDEFKTAGASLAGLGVERVIYVWPDVNKKRPPAVRIYSSAESYTTLPGGIMDLRSQLKFGAAWGGLTGHLPELQSKELWQQTSASMFAQAENIYPGHPEHAESKEFIEEFSRWVEEYLGAEITQNGSARWKRHRPIRIDEVAYFPLKNLRIWLEASYAMVQMSDYDKHRFDRSPREKFTRAELATHLLDAGYDTKDLEVGGLWGRVWFKK